jgi:hypothetical protein
MKIKNNKKILHLSFLIVGLIAWFLMNAHTAQAACETPSGGQWCERCSTIKPCTWVKWYDKDGGCDSDWYNCRSESANDSCDRCPAGQQCYQGKCGTKPECTSDDDCPVGYVCHLQKCIQPCGGCETCCCNKCSPLRPGWKCVCSSPTGGTVNWPPVCGFEPTPAYLSCTGQEVQECCNDPCYEWKNGHCQRKPECGSIDCVQPSDCGHIYQKPCPDVIMYPDGSGQRVCSPGCFEGLTFCQTPNGPICLPNCDCKWPGENCRNNQECCEGNCINGVCGGTPPPPPSTNNPPSATNLKVTQPDYCKVGPGATIFSWKFTDPDGDSQSAYRIQIATSSTFSLSSIVIDKTINSSSKNFTPQTGLNYNTTYYWRVMVWDSKGAQSLWSYGPSFTTPKHPWPTPDFTFSPEKPYLGQVVQFTDKSQAFGGAKIESWYWTFQNGNPPSSTIQNPTTTFSSIGESEITLKVTDSSGYSCSASKSLRTTYPLPFWKEIPPSF